MGKNQFCKFDASRADGVYIQFERVCTPDELAEGPDARDEGFWPSEDPSAPGYVAPERFKDEMQKAIARMDAFERGDWHYCGVRARAHIHVISNGTGTRYTLESAGLWGVESDAGAYLNDVYEEEKADLLADIKAFGAAAVVEQW